MNSGSQKKAVVFVASEQKAFLLSVVHLLEKKYNYKVIIAARDKYVIKFVEGLLPDRKFDIDVSRLTVELDESCVIEEAMVIEKKYKFNFSKLISEDRALGQGYLSNAEKVPDIIRASWSHKRKLIEVITEFKKIENIVRGSDLVIELAVTNEKYLPCNRLNIPIFGFRSIKFGNRMFWSNNPYNSSSKFIDRIKSNLSLSLEKDEVYEILGAGEAVNNGVNFSLRNSMFLFSKLFINDTKNWLRGMQKKNSYHYLGWAPTIFRKLLHYNFVKRKSIFIEDVKGYKLVFFALHLEPERALQNYSPEFSNSMEAIIWISKSLPANYLLLVKEQVLSYGIRSKWYYQQLIKMPNVVLVNPKVHSWELISCSEIVATITGTIGQEAVHHKKPVLSFGKHQVINHLPTVCYVSNYSETSKAINLFLSKKLKNHDFIHSKRVLAQAQLDSSIDFPKYKDLKNSKEIGEAIAGKALESLFSEYPSLN